MVAADVLKLKGDVILHVQTDTSHLPEGLSPAGLCAERLIPVTSFNPQDTLPGLGLLNRHPAETGTSHPFHREGDTPSVAWLPNTSAGGPGSQPRTPFLRHTAWP